MKYELLAQGFVTQRQPGTPVSVAAGSRCVARGNGELACSFMGQAAIGHNDFKPMLVWSSDNGATWTEPRLIWPELQDRVSIFGSVSRAPNGDLYFYGMRTPIAYPGELAWNAEVQGMKQNELVWTRSADFGRTWGPLQVIPMPIPGSAEAAGPLCVTTRGDLVCCYAPYRTFDPTVAVDANQVVGLLSQDGGRTWSHRPMLRFPGSESNGAEAWVVELSDGRLLGTGWHVHPDGNRPNAYALSLDRGRTWSPTGSTGTLGQSTGLAALSDGRAAFVYNQRKHGAIGVWLAIARPDARNFGILLNERIWAAEIATQDGRSADFSDWTGFAFGEPSVTVLHDGSLLVTLWCLQPSGHGIRYVRLRIV
ncbi:MAG: exo-alpha-sialidase [Verrucomicrobia bacterium]|nr:exo-alpha-sialidase [Verrucomicrobiota bacterium]